MSMGKEFKEFAMKGNVVDMAVGIIIGAAFGRIVTSLVSDVLMPPIGILLGGLDFSSFMIVLKEAVGTQGPVAVKYGVFINVLIDFIMVAFCIFMMIRAMNSMKRKAPEAAAAPVTKDCPECFMTIPIQAKRCGHCTAVLSQR